jgi:hypothetical protein
MPEGRLTGCTLSFLYSLPYRLKPIILARFVLVRPIVSLQSPGEPIQANPKGNKFHRWAKYSQLHREKLLEGTSWLWVPLSDVQFHHLEIMHAHKRTMKSFALRMSTIY